MYKLGVLMTVYRRDDPAFFQRAISSILEQNISTPVELRIYLGVDGPVPEPLRAAIEGFAPQIYKLFRYEENRGLARVLSDLIAAREDEAFFFRMDADDVSHPERFQRQLTYMLEHPRVDILGTDMVEVDEAKGTERIVRFAESPEDARKWISLRNPLAHPTVCFRARVFEKVPAYPPLSQSEDVAMWFECLRAGLVIDNLHEPLHQFRFDADFWHRRAFLRPWKEFLIFTRGLWRLDRFTWKYINPIIRLMIRLAPLRLQKLLYSSPLRVKKGAPRFSEKSQ